MHIFYSPEIANGANTLSESESKHCVNVLRLRSNDPIYLVDGKGGYYLAKITHADPRRCEFKIVKTQNNYGKRSYYLHIAIAPTKSIDRFEWFLEKSVEIGVDKITPLLCNRSERKRIKMERIERIVLSAMKQSEQAFMPGLNPLIPYQDFISRESDERKIIAHCSEGNKPLLREIVDPGDRMLIMIGPEGDFTPEEIGLATSNNFLEADLGPSRLRTETAGVMVCATMSLINQ